MVTIRPRTAIDVLVAGSTGGLGTVVSWWDSVGISGAPGFGAPHEFRGDLVGTDLTDLGCDLGRGHRDGGDRLHERRSRGTAVEPAVDVLGERVQLPGE